MKFLPYPPEDIQGRPMSKPQNNTLIPLTAGHRERVQDKFLKLSDPGLMPDYELLELILMKSIPRIDVKPLAKELINHFGTLSDVLSAEPEELSQFRHVKQSTIALFKIILEVNRRTLCHRLKEMPVLERWNDLLDYCCLNLQNQTIEHCMILYLDARFRLLRREMPHSGTTDRVFIYPREILKQALIVGASAVVVVHNHPSGHIEPSEADQAITVELYHTLAAGRVKLLDHLIIGPGRKVYSFSSHGHLTVQPKRNTKSSQ